jgi:hypothetical protein
MLIIFVKLGCPSSESCNKHLIARLGSRSFPTSEQLLERRERMLQRQRCGCRECLLGIICMLSYVIMSVVAYKSRKLVVTYLKYIAKKGGHVSTLLHVK